MTISSGRNAAGERRTACPRCGTVFGCNLSGGCWCNDISARLPLPTNDEDCLCPACLRAVADAARRTADDRSKTSDLSKS
ncbi:cysteine-rich CWC family protein [Bradyrhizobium sp. WD16]|uniref:cysteine-rich CWC family protein n=1 Tax=Bradyrhizobium sp. WD16 TaxID=1521768 RepID=UPI0020A27F7D|nr:cysteine-rich CWC family protein [Bradyrhizobium sp. WD16]UTD30401.1 hypothetical protein DB459_13280 [Bradyrhizobium sp. WD16]